MTDIAKQKEWVVRTIKDGQVQIYGEIYVPSRKHQEYDGRLDGMRYAFARYRSPRERVTIWEPFIALWGTEKRYRALGKEEIEYGPECVDGFFPWEWWYRLDIAHSKKEALP